MSNTKSFTLIELLIVIGVLAVLVAAIVVTLNPAQLLAQARDSKRQQDLSALNQSLNTITALDQSLFMGTSSIVYTSLPDSSSTCGSWNLPSLPSGWQYHCSPTTTLQNTDGNGWIPVNFKTTGVISLSSLPIDPINTSSTGLYYTYVSGGSFELTAAFESSKFKLGGDKDIVSTDGGLYPDLYEVGSNLSLQPLDHGDTSLVGYWPLNEGTGTIAYDRSGHGNNGTLTTASSTCGSACYPQWTTSGCLSSGSCLSFSYTSSTYVYTTSSPSVSGNFTVSTWISIAGPGPVFFNTRQPSDYSFDMQVNYGGCGGQSGLHGDIGNGSSWLTTSANLCSMSFLMYNNTWYNVIYVVQPSSYYIYLNGILAASGTYSPSNPLLSDNYHLIQFGLGALTGASFTGLLSNVRIYNRALTLSQIRAIYNARQ